MGIGSAFVTRRAGATIAAASSSDTVASSVMTWWSRRKRSGARTTFATGGRTAMITVSQASSTAWLSDAMRTSGKLAASAAARCAPRGDTTTSAATAGACFIPVTMAAASAPVPMNPSFIGRSLASEAAPVGVAGDHEPRLRPLRVEPRVVAKGAADAEVVAEEQEILVVRLREDARQRRKVALEPVRQVVDALRTIGLRDGLGGVRRHAGQLDGLAKGFQEVALLRLDVSAPDAVRGALAVQALERD